MWNPTVHEFKSKFVGCQLVRCSSPVCVAIIYIPNVQISFKSELFLPLGHIRSDFSFRNHGHPWEEILQNYTPPTNRNRKFWNWNFPPSGPHQISLGMFEILKIEILMVFNSAFLCYCKAELLSSRGRPSSIVRPCPSSVNPVFFQNSSSRLMPKFGGKVPFHNISKPFFFQILHFWFFTIFFFFFRFR